MYSTRPPDRAFLNLQSAAGLTALDLARDAAHRKMEARPFLYFILFYFIFLYDM